MLDAHEPKEASLIDFDNYSTYMHLTDVSPLTFDDYDNQCDVLQLQRATPGEVKTLTIARASRSEIVDLRKRKVIIIRSWPSTFAIKNFLLRGHLPKNEIDIEIVLLGLFLVL